MEEETGGTRKERKEKRARCHQEAALPTVPETPSGQGVADTQRASELGQPCADPGASAGPIRTALFVGGPAPATPRGEGPDRRRQRTPHVETPHRGRGLCARRRRLPRS